MENFPKNGKNKSEIPVFFKNFDDNREREDSTSNL